MQDTSKGNFITLEGGEGSGKTTVITALEKWLQENGFKVVKTREPGGIPIAEKIRSLVLEPEYSEMDARTEALLYAAARRQHLVERVFPALAEGAVVLCDRFVDSSLAYQGAARGLGMDAVAAVNEFAIEGCMPDLTLMLDVDPEEGIARIQRAEEREWNRLDNEAARFHSKVHEAYMTLAEKYPSRIKRIDAEQPLEKVFQDCREKVQNYLNAKN
ncbi:dTMP kinase [Marinococcus halophilus]|uniref:Thymidylate kinase n=1 Tax=Marinococcus halophilus TaxID=1371 RepID=A0A510Y8S7_MARHA|nr:dTMP kinase [Marinococcus halophilus]OZT79206.1 dTMP kinase [Marinococcus halophilus]GEK59765.1 thymidylate kinase [Marinococcus halophilus]